MKVLYSNILPLATTGTQEIISDCFIEQLKVSDCIDIAVGYISRAGLDELEHLVEIYQIREIHLTIGMYFVEGMPEALYHASITLNDKWIANGVGDIKIVRAFKYHGKLYCFHKNNKPFSAIIGSANLGAIKLDANNRRQYEISVITKEYNECLEIANFIKKLTNVNCSANISEIDDLLLIRETNTALDGIDKVTQLPLTEVQLYMKHKTNISFELPIKVPTYEERHIDDYKHFTKSNINVCYAKPRSKLKSRDWYETQLTVGLKITRLKGYPEKRKPFFVITDDGYWFKAHTTSDGNKQFSAVGDELILGRWIKGRLASAGLVYPSNDTQKDIDRKSMITKEILKAFGCEKLLLTKTTKKALDESESVLDVWILSFESND